MTETSQHRKIHFYYPSFVQTASDYAATFIDHFGQASVETCDVIVAIGGDGTILCALDQGYDKPVYGVTPPQSNSIGALMDHTITDVRDLEDRLDRASCLSLTRLQADVHFADGTVKSGQTYSDIVVKILNNVNPNQAAILDLKFIFTDAAANTTHSTMNFIGDGLVFATPLASTGYTTSNGGVPVDLRVDSISLSGISTYKPDSFAHRGAVLAPDAVMEITPPPATQNKRPLIVGIGNVDAFSAADQGSAITKIVVKKAEENTAKLMIYGDAAQHVVQKIAPQI